ncbi:type I glyceraldehyde-3-phosphate dehydrogenase [Sessilibacter sp. MAH1]
MSTRVAINGFGRIGRNILRACYEGNYKSNYKGNDNDQIEIVAINDLGDASINAHLTQYDSVHGRFAGDVSVEGDSLLVNGDRIRCVQERSPKDLPWKELDVDVVLECTGLFTDRAAAAGHIEAGAKKVIVSAPGKNMDATVVYGINHKALNRDHQIISNASCTTNCLAPLASVLNRAIGIERGLMTTIHSYTNDQKLSDVYHTDLYRARSATQSMIPTKTGAAQAIGLVLPELAGRLDGLAVRVPTINVSLVDFTFDAARATSVDEINSLMAEAAQGELGCVLNYSEAPLVSIDYNHSLASCNFDASHTRVQGNLVKVLAWYDNEWGFANRMLDNTLALASTF